MKGHGIAALFLSGLLLLAPAVSHGLIIVMPNSDWVTQYAVGLCNAKYQTDNYLDWHQLVAAPNGSVKRAEGEVVCILGHGAPGKIGDVAGDTIAATVAEKLDHTAEASNPVLLMACMSAVAPLSGRSVLQSFESVRGAWSGNAVTASLGICVANRNGSSPLYRTVLKNPLPGSGDCSMKALTDEQARLKLQIQANIASCQTRSGTLAIGQCMYDLDNDDGKAINDKFYVPFLAYITDKSCNQTPGTASGTM
ncbi:hypothetical protein A7R81_27570 [Pseudomonas aeruginosa]|nr:hypothetical protein A7R81_27570 [Pseudomonas aeruginosa]